MRRTRPIGPGSRRVVAVALAVVCCAAALAACGSSSRSSSSAAAGGGGGSGIEFSDCMRSHGVPNFPDPGAGGGGFQIGSGSGINPQSPAFVAAQNDCARFLPRPGGGRAVSEAQKLMMLKLSQCMRAHGLASFPDPVSTPPAPGTGFGIAFGAPGSFIAVPAALMQSPAFNQAAAKCGFPGFGRGGGAKTAAP